MYWNCIGVRYSFKRPSKLIVMSVVKYDNMTYVCVVFGTTTVIVHIACERNWNHVFGYSG